MSDEQPRKITLKWPLDDDLPLFYANQFGPAKTEHEVVLTFGEFLPVGFHNRKEEEIDEYLSDAVVKPRAKVVMSRGGFKAFLGM